jgi:uncharacterized protein (TIGR02599 family)
MKPFPLSGPRNRSHGFSLMELMVSTAVLSLLLVMVFQMLNGMQLSWKRTKQVVGEFKEARQAFEDITRRVGQATLNAYMSYRYDTATVQGVQLRVGREIIPQSELHFVCGPVANLGINQKNSRQVGQRYTHAVFFQAPFGFCIDPDSQRQTTLRFGRFNNSMNAWGYYIEFNTDELDRPRLLTDLPNAPSPRPRYRLMEFRQPTEYFQAYKLNLRDMASNSSRPQLYRWFTEGLYSVNSEWNTQVQPTGTQGFFRTTRVVADNIIAMILRPRAANQIEGVAGASAPPIAPDFHYDTRRFQWEGGVRGQQSRHILPPILDITFVAVDENSFVQFAAQEKIRSAEDDPVLVNESYFRESQQFNKDLQNLEQDLQRRKLDYRVFTTSVRLRESRWQENNLN